MSLTKRLWVANIVMIVGSAAAAPVDGHALGPMFWMVMIAWATTCALLVLWETIEDE